MNYKILKNGKPTNYYLLINEYKFPFGSNQGQTCKNAILIEYTNNGIVSYVVDYLFSTADNENNILQAIITHNNLGTTLPNSTTKLEKV